MDKLQDKIEKYVYEMRYKNIDNILVTKKGNVLCEINLNPAYRYKKHYIASIQKSIISLGTGIALDKGYLRLDDNIDKYITIKDTHKRITIRDLLTLSSGIYWQFGIHASQPIWSTIELEENWLEAILELPEAYTPGTKFYYKDSDVYLLTQVLQRASNRSIEEFIYENLYAPLGISCNKIDDDWGINRNNMTNISMLTAHEMARIGNLCLDGGKYGGKQLISEEYLKLAMQKQITTHEFIKYFGSGDYGFLWWIFEDAYFARGFGGNEIAVFPKYDLVVVIQATAKKISKEYLDVIYDVILKDELILS